MTSDIGQAKTSRRPDPLRGGAQPASSARRQLPGSTKLDQESNKQPEWWHGKCDAPLEWMWR